ncbi:hypothetical protein BZA05DRAFT_211427 [Tricharina praecox]|uniref:uncharacterized protein n=1 Tax=Tricharina praecox TaxID=43433 RepID=UPI00221EF6EF|nr:uncharacterized protein BZA05DRAFT_211427 [Tricharina praecox]KAI5841636.1 hypothetical protein BZA05DRAFT_211427 [Tricharina praecox]
MLREVWRLNYMHDIAWVMGQFDEDIARHVKAVFAHGNWSRTICGGRGWIMDEQVKVFRNARIVAAYMPEAFGTHHTKIMLLFRGDDTAQFVGVFDSIPRTNDSSIGS